MSEACCDFCKRPRRKLDGYFLITVQRRVTIAGVESPIALASKPPWCARACEDCARKRLGSLMEKEPPDDQPATEQ